MLKKGLWFLLFLFGGFSDALAQDQGHGRITMNGQIIASACTIAAEDVYQSINLGELPLRTLVADGQGPLRAFSLHLIKCVLNKESGKGQWRDVLVTFDGVADGTSLFATQGEAQGVGIRIMDSHQQIAAVGRVMNATELEPDTTTLKYQLQLVRNSAALRAGEFSSVIKFMVNYQ
ncbi:TPA: type 1 fimbrial protein [Escherichia coli]|nr:type 1 fimbrial protein [Escherichia coli]